MAQAGKDRLKAKIGDAQLAARAPPEAAAEAAPAASAALGSVLESGMASGVAATPDAEHVDDAGTPHRTLKVEVCFWLPLQLESSMPPVVQPLLLQVSHQMGSMLDAPLIMASAPIKPFTEHVPPQAVLSQQQEACLHDK